MVWKAMLKTFGSLGLTVQRRAFSSDFQVLLDAPEKRYPHTSQGFLSRHLSTASGDWILISHAWQGAPPPLHLIRMGLRTPVELVGKCPTTTCVAAMLGKQAETK